MPRKGVCDNIGNCDLADNDTIQEVADTEEFVCSEPLCKKPLRSSGGIRSKIPQKYIFIASGLILIPALFFLLRGCMASSENSVCIKTSDEYKFVLISQLNDFPKGSYENIDSSFCVCMIACAEVPIDTVCGSDGKKYKNLECLACHPNISEIKCSIDAEPDTSLSGENYSLPEFDDAKMKDEVTAVLKNFFTNISNLATTNDRAHRDILKETIKQQFLDPENVIVEVLPNKNSDVLPLPLEKYLSRVEDYDYDKVNVKIANVELSQFSDNSNSEFLSKTAEAMVNQTFSASKINKAGNKITYTDVTKKGINIIVVIEEGVPGGAELRWKPYLANIYVTEIY